MLMASKLFEKLCFAWSGDYESLKQFVKDDLNLEGTWSQPGGDRKLFTLGDSTILWKKNKNVLRLDGARANEIMQSLCKLVCSFEAPTSDDRQPSMQSAAVCDTLGDLQRGQSVNSEAIRALSGTITHITSVMSQLQNFTDKYNAVLCDITLNTSREAFEYGNHETICDGNKAIDDSPSGSNEFTNLNVSNASEPVNYITGSEHGNQEATHGASEAVDVSSLAPNEQTDLSATERLKSKQTPTQGYMLTYADIVSSCETVTSNKHKSISQKSPCKTKEMSCDPDGFIGVERKRRKTKKFFLTGIAENVNENQILSYLNKKNIIPTYISIFSSRRRGVLSLKIHVPSAASSLVQEENFWPKYVICKPWRAKDDTKNPLVREINLTHKGTLSTFV